MKKNPSLFLVFGLSAAGLLAGYSARRLTGDPRSFQANKSDQETDRTHSRLENPPADASIPSAKAAAPRVVRHSNDTLETLAALGKENRYTRVALWLVDASEADIAAFWKDYSGADDSDAINNLVFLNWTRFDPRAAIAATARTSSSHLPWWAWACHDPKAALAAAIAADPEFVESVALGIGEFHPEWLREHFEEIPESASGEALMAMTKWSVHEKPLESLTFMKKYGVELDPETLKLFARQDPWAALDWAKHQKTRTDDPFGSSQDTVQIVIDTMATDYPEDLARVVAQTPSGEAKLKMEAALFNQLLKTDPATALEQAKSTTVPHIAAERYAAIGLNVMKTDPEQALQLAQSLLAACPGALNMITIIELPDDSATGSGLTIPGVDDFMTELMAKTPARLMDLNIAMAQQEDGPFQRLSQVWAEQDLAAYTKWVNQQTDENVHQAGGLVIVNSLQQQSHYEEAAEWAVSLKQAGVLRGVIWDWKHIAPDDAAHWLESSALPADRKAEIKSQMENTNE